MYTGCIKIVLFLLFLVQFLYGLLTALLHNTQLSNLQICKLANTRFCALFLMVFFSFFHLYITTSLTIMFSHIIITALAYKYFKLFSLLSILLYYLLYTAQINISNQTNLQLFSFYIVSLIIWFINTAFAFIIVLEICNLYIYILLLRQSFNTTKLQTVGNVLLLKTTNLAYYFWASFFALISYILGLYIIFYGFYTFNFSIILLLYKILYLYIIFEYRLLLSLFLVFFMLFFCIKFGFVFFIVWKFKFFTLFNHILFYVYYCYYITVLLFSFISFYLKILIVILQICKVLFISIILCNCFILYTFWNRIVNLYQFFVVSSLINLTFIFLYLWSYLNIFFFVIV